MRLTLRQLSVYQSHIPSLMAQEAMTQSVVASVPYMDEETRGEVMRDWQAVAGQEVTAGVPERISFDDFVKGDMKERVV
jgi:uncharacterized protein YcsI (UPF0317 family)